MRMRPQTTEIKAASERLRQSIMDSIALRKTMSPVDRALEYADQRKSFVRGMVDHEPDLSEDPLQVLADEVRKLRRKKDSWT